MKHRGSFRSAASALGVLLYVLSIVITGSIS